MKSKLVRGGLVLIPAFVLSMSMGTGAMAYSGQAVEAAKVTGEITIDGDLSDWDTSSPVTANTEEQVVRDVSQWTEEEADCSFEVYAMWDEENLYIAAKVLDDTPFMYREGFPPDMADSLVVFLSTNPDDDPERTEYSATDFRYTQVIDDYGDFFNGIDRDMVADNQGFETIGDDGCDQVVAIEAAFAEIDGGYIYESKVPLSNFSNENIAQLVPEAGMTIGWEIGMFDLDFPCPGVATTRMQACASEDADTNPSLWGTLTFTE